MTYPYTEDEYERWRGAMLEGCAALDAFQYFIQALSSDASHPQAIRDLVQEARAWEMELR